MGLHLRAIIVLGLAAASASAEGPSSGIPLVDLAGETGRQVVVDREAGQYLGHPTTVLLEDGRTILCVYPKGHGKGAIVYKRSEDGGKTWSARLPTPASWATSLETPTIYRTVDRGGKKRLLLFSGLYPIRLSVSEDDGASWSELRPIGPYGGIVAMASLVRAARRQPPRDVPRRRPLLPRGRVGRRRLPALPGALGGRGAQLGRASPRLPVGRGAPVRARPRAVSRREDARRAPAREPPPEERARHLLGRRGGHLVGPARAALDAHRRPARPALRARWPAVRHLPRHGRRQSRRAATGSDGWAAGRTSSRAARDSTGCAS